MISFEEAAFAWSKIVVRAEQAEFKVKALEEEVNRLKRELSKVHPESE
jgi:uncharacterized protein involved in tolerance to divalent cations